jgi:hypothetical protein
LLKKKNEKRLVQRSPIEDRQGLTPSFHRLFDEKYLETAEKEFVFVLFMQRFIGACTI